MKGLYFGELHTWEDFKLIMVRKEISAPEPKTHLVEVEGADGSLDFSEAFGEIKFKRRKLTYEFASLVSRDKFWTEFSRVQNVLHGKMFRIIDDEDPDYYYVGRVIIDKWKIDKVVGSFKIEIDAEPYKYRLTETIRTEHITGTQCLSIWNDRMSVNPIFRVTSPMTLVFAGNTLSLSSIDSDFTHPDIVFKEGNNILDVTGEGIITIRYQEGSL